MRFRRSLLAFAILVSLTALGCGGDDLNRRNLRGKVTFKGEPVPYGTLSFRPDHKKGGSGPTGFARIEDGEYNTSGDGKGAMVGPVKVFIEGAVSNKPMAASLFPMFRTEIEVGEDTEEYDFEVPEPAARPRSRR